MFLYVLALVSSMFYGHCVTGFYSFLQCIILVFLMLLWRNNINDDDDDDDDNVRIKLLPMSGS